MKLSPSSWTKIQTARGWVFTPRSANSAVSPRSVNGPAAKRSRSQSATSPDRVRGLWPPTWAGANDPVSRSRLVHLETHEGLKARHILTIHGLRHTRGVELAAAGASDAEIMSQLEHTSTRAAEIYRRQADRRGLANSGQEKIDQAIAKREAQAAKAEAK